jgi:hypothetical protein
MGFLNINKQYKNGSRPTANQIEAFTTSIETFVNNSKLNSDNFQSGGIGIAKIADGEITRDVRASIGQQLSSSCGSAVATTSLADVSNLSCTLTTNGRPVMIQLQADGSTSVGRLLIESLTTGNTGTLDIAILRDSTIVSYQKFEIVNSINGPTISHAIPSSCIWTIDSPSAGTYTYKIQAIKSGTGTMYVQYSKLAVWEL